MKFSKIHAFIFTIFLFSLFLTNFVEAQQPEKNDTTINLKVAYYQLEGFFEYDSNGKEVGYGVDFLNELKKYINVNWEFVPVDSWEKIGPMIRAKEVDVRMPVSEPSKPSQYYAYSVEPVLNTFHALMTLKTRTDLYFHDYNAISKMKIAATAGLIEKTGFRDYLDGLGVWNNIVFYDDYNSCLASVQRGETDGLISNIMDFTNELKILDKFYVVKNYITMLKDNPNLVLINDAMTQLSLDNPAFVSNLYMKYFPERVVDPYTKDELTYLQQHKTIKVGVYSNRKPVTYVDSDTGKVSGISIDIANIIAHRLGVTFEYVPLNPIKPIVEYLDDVDLVMPIPQNPNPEKYATTPSILNSEVVFVTQQNRYELRGKSKIGVLSSTDGIKSYVEKINNFEVVLFETVNEAMNAVHLGRIDAYANSSFVVYNALQNPRFKDLKILPYGNISINYSIASKKENSALNSALNKAVSRLSTTEISRAIENNTTFDIDNFSTMDKLFFYREELFIALLALVILFILAVLYNHSRNHYIKEIEKESLAHIKASNAKTEFLSRMSHDMRTPMNGILGLTYIMQDETDIKQIHSELPKLREAGEYLLQLINDILDVSKVESGSIKLNPQPTDGKILFESIFSMMNPQLEAKKIALNVKTENVEWTTLNIDDQRVKQIFLNILSNAIKFTPENGHIDVSMETVKKTPDYVYDKFVIRDSGIGMSEEFLPKLFEPFTQENRAPSGTVGTGLGMSIVKSLVELMDGSISVKSKINEGTEFTIFLKLQTSNVVLKQNENPIQAIEQLPPNTKVLLCEDHPLNAQIAIRLLTKKGADVTWKENGQQGLDEFIKSDLNSYDIILMDIRMPVMDGIEATKRIRALDRADAKNVLIVAMSANAYADDIQKSLDSGMNAHLAKPIEPAKLFKTMNQLLKK